jgi:hypothetical protein
MTGCVYNVKEFMKMVDHSEDEELEDWHYWVNQGYEL